jgi:hypothetical protein
LLGVVGVVELATEVKAGRVIIKAQTLPGLTKVPFVIQIVIRLAYVNGALDIFALKVIVLLNLTARI